MEGELWSGENHLRDEVRETTVKNEDRIWVMNKGGETIGK